MYLTHLFSLGGGSVTHTVFHAYSLYSRHISYLSPVILCMYIHCCTTIYIIYTLPCRVYTVGLPWNTILLGRVYDPPYVLPTIYASTVCYRVLSIYCISAIRICCYPIYYPVPMCTTMPACT